MQARFKLAVLTAAMLAASGASHAFEFHGYLRSGAGSASKDGTQQCFQLPGAYAKYRLGNECETYAELAFDHDLFEGKDGVKFAYHGKLAYVAGYDKQQQDFENLNENGRQLALRENWIEVKGLPWMSGGTVWAGKRFYERQDIHINDFYYWDTSGYGIGAKDYNAGPVRLSYALFRNTANEKSAVTRHDFRVGGIQLGEGAGDLTIGLQYNSADTSERNNDTSGSAITVQHFLGGVMGGFNKFAVQYGKGTARNLVFAYPGFGEPENNKTLRVVEILQVQPSADFSAMGTVIYQKQDDNYKWLSFGVRPVIHFSDYFKLQFEYGHDEVKPIAGDSNNRRTRKLDKFTVAPTLVAGRGFWARPELRVFATHAKWNDAARDLWGGVGGSRYANSTSGTTYGFQVEAWW